VDGSPSGGEYLLTQDQRRRGQDALTNVAACFAVFMACSTGSVGTLFLLSLGATPFHIGVLTTLTQMMVPVAQFVGLLVIFRVGKARLAVIGRAAAAIPILFLAVLAMLDASGAGQVWAAIGAFALVTLLVSAANTGWWPLLQDNTAGDRMGAFFARLRTRLRIFEILLPFLVGAYLGTRPERAKFLLPFCVAAASMLVGAWLMRFVAERVAQRPAEGLIRRLVGTATHAPIRRFMWFIASRSFILSLATPFWVVLLTSRGLSARYVVWLGAVVALGHLCGLQWWGWLVDRHRSRAALTITLIPEAVLGLAWLLIPATPIPLLAWAVAFHMVWGFLEGGYFMGQTRAMMDAVPLSRQTEGFALVSYSSALGGMLGGFLGGVFFQAVTERCVGPAGLDSRAMYLAWAQLLMTGVWWTTTRLPDHHRQTPAREVGTQVWKRLQALFSEKLPQLRRPF